MQQKVDKLMLLREEKQLLLVKKSQLEVIQAMKLQDLRLLVQMLVPR